jgi:hypothetical protein
MTARSRLLALLAGEPVDRPAIWTQVPFAVTASGLVPGAFHGYDDYDDWRSRDPRYRALVERMNRECDNPFIWRPPSMQNLQFVASPAVTFVGNPEPAGERVRFTTEVRLGGRTLREVREVKPGTGHSWQIEHLCTSIDDAQLLLEHNWTGEPVFPGDFTRLQSLLGDRGVMWVTIPSPIMVVARLFDPMEFLLLVRTESLLVRELLEITASRIESHLEQLLDLGAGPVIRFGGAEHATPPLMGPDDFDRLVVEFDAPLVALCKSRGRFVAYHCHGNLRHALGRFREMGVDQIDPTETLPDGDITIEEARRIAGDRMVLAGNVQCRELFSDAVGVDVIRRRVRAIIDGAGPRLIVTTTGTPLEPIGALTEAKYHAMIDEALDRPPR